MGQEEQRQLRGTGAEMYERGLVPAIFAPWAAVLIKQAALQRGERVLDVACGTGVVARLAAKPVGSTGRIIGLDKDAERLAVACSLPPVPGVSLEWQESNALAMPFADASFDALLCQQGLQFFPDRPAALREMHRALVPGGRLILSVWGSLEQCPGYAALVGALSVTLVRQQPQRCVLFLPWERLRRYNLFLLGDRSTRSNCTLPPGQHALRRPSNLCGSK